MRIASIDMGSNSFLLLIAKVSPLGDIKVEYEDLKVVRLGEKLDQTGRFSKESLERASEALQAFHSVITSYNVDWVEAVTTSAARRASNFADLKIITDLLAIPLNVITGDEEAKLTYLGASSEPNSVIVDVGGGSTEVVTEEGGRYIGHSFEFGSVRLLEKHITQQPIVNKEIEALEEDLRTQLNEHKNFFKSLKDKSVVAVAGTPTTLAALVQQTDYQPDKIEGLELTVNDVEFWINKLSQLNVDERMQYKALSNSPKRADVIVVGLECLKQTLLAIGCKTFKVSTKGVRYGLVKDIYSKHCTLLADN